MCLQHCTRGTKMWRPRQKRKHQLAPAPNLCHLVRVQLAPLGAQKWCQIGASSEEANKWCQSQLGTKYFSRRV